MFWKYSNLAGYYGIVEESNSLLGQRVNMHTSFFKVTIWFPKWRSLKPALKRSQKWVPNEVTLKNTQVLCWEPILRIVWKITFRWPIFLIICICIGICIHVCEWMWWFESENWTEIGMSLRAMLPKICVAVRLHQILYLVHMNPFGGCRNPITEGNYRIDSFSWREPYIPFTIC